MRARARLEALNAAYHCIGQGLPGVDRERVIVVVVDADGRIAPTAPRYAAAHFEDPEVGGVQALVRIYNRTGFLTQMQDVEFSVYGSVYQAGRNRAGTAGHGRERAVQPPLRAGRDRRAEPGHGDNRLTEDQDLGLRLLAAGWKSHQELRAVVEQQGVPRLRPLLRQRTRWAQGNLQALDLIGAIWRSPFPRQARAGTRCSTSSCRCGRRSSARRCVCAIALAALRPWLPIMPSAEHPARGLRPRLLELRAGLPRDPQRDGLAELAAGHRHRPPLRALHVAAVSRCSCARSPGRSGRGATGRAPTACRSSRRPRRRRPSDRTSRPSRSANGLRRAALAHGGASAAYGGAPTSPLCQRIGGAGDPADEEEEPHPEQVQNDDDDPRPQVEPPSSRCGFTLARSAAQDSLTVRISCGRYGSSTASPSTSSAAPSSSRAFARRADENGAATRTRASPRAP